MSKPSTLTNEKNSRLYIMSSDVHSKGTLKKTKLIPNNSFFLKVRWFGFIFNALWFFQSVLLKCATTPHARNKAQTNHCTVSRMKPFTRFGQALNTVFSVKEQFVNAYVGNFVIALTKLKWTNFNETIHSIRLTADRLFFQKYTF